MPGCGFSRSYGILQHGRLSRVQAGRESRISIRIRIVSDPKVDAAMRRQKDGVASDKVIVDPTRRGPGDDPTGEEKNGQGNPMVTSLRPGPEASDEKKGKKEKNGGNAHR